MTREQRNVRALSRGELAHELGRQTAHTGIIAIVSQLMRLVIQIGGTAVMARLLAPADFGLIAMAATVTGFIAIFTDMGMSTATIQRPEVDQQLVSTLFLLNMLFGIGLMLAAIAAAPLAAWFFDDPRVTLVVIGLSVAIPLSAAAAQHNALLIRRLRMFTVQAIAIASQVAGLMVAVYIALYTDWSYFALIFQAVVPTIISLILTWRAADWLPSFSTKFAHARNEIKFGFYIVGFNFLNYFHRQFDNVLIGYRYGSVELGYYSRGYNLLTVPINVVNASLAQTALPALARLNTDIVRWRRAFAQTLSIACFGSVGLCAVLFVNVDPLVHLLLGERWTPVIGILQYLTIASIFGSATHGCGWAFISLGRTRAFFFWGLISSTFFVLSFAAGLPWGALGVAAAYSIAMAINAPIYLAVTARIAGISFNDLAGRLLPPLLVSGVTCYAGTTLLNQLGIEASFWRLVVGTILGASLYAAMALASLMLPQYSDLRSALAKIIKQGLWMLKLSKS